VAQAVPEGEPKALACSGLLVRWRPDTAAATEALWLRFVDGRSVSGVATAFLAARCGELAAAGKTTLLLVRDNASWYLSREVRERIGAHNRAATRREAAVRIVVCPLPSKSPWLNPIEAKWVHGKCRVAEPGRLLSPAEMEVRIYAALGAEHADHLTMPHQAA
jgi:hypothetical protein